MNDCALNLSQDRIAELFKHIDTKLVHAGEPTPRILGSVSMSIFQSAMFEYTGEATYHDLKYILLNNTPNHEALHRKLSALENAENALVTSSSMAAISTTLLTVLSDGDHLLTQNCLYGGTHIRMISLMLMIQDHGRGNCDRILRQSRLRP